MEIPHTYPFQTSNQIPDKFLSKMERKLKLQREEASQRVTIALLFRKAEQSETLKENCELSSVSSSSSSAFSDSEVIPQPSNWCETYGLFAKNGEDSTDNRVEHGEGIMESSGGSEVMTIHFVDMYHFDPHKEYRNDASSNDFQLFRGNVTL